MLPLKPVELNEVALARRGEMDFAHQQGRSRSARIHQSTEGSRDGRAMECLCQPHARWQPSPRGQSIEDIQLLRPPARSRFSEQRSGLPCVLHKLTTVELGRLERWALNHVKTQYISAFAETHLSSPHICHKHNLSRKMTTMCELLRKLAGGTGLTEDQHHFMFDLLQSLPLLDSFPTAVLSAVAAKLRVVSRTQHIEIFRQGEPAEGIYVLVQGLVELRGGCDAPVVTKRAPFAILPTDVLIGCVPARFELREPIERYWSCTVTTAQNSDDLSLTTMFVFVPVSVLDEVAALMKAEQTRKMEHYITKMFARAMHVSPKLCLRRARLFRLQEFPRTHVLLHMGDRPPLGTAQLALVVEGQVSLVGPRPADRGYQRYLELRGGCRKASSVPPWCELVSAGAVLGQAPMYGLSYAHTAIIASEKAVILSLHVQDYLDQIINHPGILDSAAVNAQPQQLNTDEPLKGASVVSSEARRLLKKRERLLRVAHDAEVLKVSEWKSLQLKAPLPRQHGAKRAGFAPPQQRLRSVGCSA